MKYFVLAEFACKHCGQALMDHFFLQRLDELRQVYGKPLIVSSGYRCPLYNAKVAKTGLIGPHTTGHAADFAIRGAEALDLVRCATALGFTGIGINQKGRDRFIHVDDLPNGRDQPRPTIWSY